MAALKHQPHVVAALATLFLSLLPRHDGFTPPPPPSAASSPSTHRVQQQLRPTPTKSGSSSSRLFGMPPRRRDDDGGGEGSDDDGARQDSIIDAERKRLEALMGSDQSQEEAALSSDDLAGDDDSDGGSALPKDWREQASNPPSLTAIGRERLETEIKLLRSLADGDAAIPELWSLWYGARGPGPRAELMKTEQLTAMGESFWDEAEMDLRKIIGREGIHWSEPVNRLATLLFLRGRYEESKEACEVVLAVKPWHFGALSGIVLVHQGLNDLDGVKAWAGQRMPPIQADLSPVMGDGDVMETRSHWVERMVEEAERRLRSAERGVADSFRNCEENSGGGIRQEEDGDDSWQ